MAANRTNYCKNPSFEFYSSPTYGTPGWSHSDNLAGTEVYSGPETPVFGDYSSRVQYTAVAGDTNATWQRYADATAGSFAESDPVTGSIYLWGTLTGVTLVLRIAYHTAADALISSTDSASITLDGTPTRYYVSGTCPALTDRVRFYLRITSIANGDGFDLNFDGCLIEKSVTMTGYFDGDTTLTEDWAYVWTGSWSYSISTESEYEPGVACLVGLPLPLPLATARGNPTDCAMVCNKTFAVDTETADITVLASTDYHVSAYIYAPVIGATVTVTVETGTSHELAVITEVNEDWVRYDVDASTGVGETTLHLKFSFGDAQSNIYVTGLLVEQTDTLKSYFDGNFVGCDWDGTENASVSRTRWR